MARPKTKSELLELGQRNYHKLLELIDSFSSEELNAAFPNEYLNKNPRDVLTHLHEWQLMMLDWYKTGMSGKKPNMPAEGYSWKTTNLLNKEIREKYQDVSLEDAKVMLEKSYRKIRKLIEKHSEEELFEKKYYKWTGTTSLASYLISSSSSHYDWAFKLIKKARKNLII